MPRLTRDAVVALLVDWGAGAEAAERIVAALERAGLTPIRMRSWLNHPERGYGIAIEPLEVAGVTTWPRSKPSRVIERGRSDAVVEAAEAFADASREERELSLAFLCGLDAVRRLTHGDAARTDRLREVVRLMHQSLGKDIAVNEALQVRLEGDTRLVDCLMDDRLGAVLAALRDGSLDPRTLDRERALGFWGW